MRWSDAVLAGAPLLPLGLTLLNVATWSRGKRDAVSDARVSVLVPARNEEANIERCLRAIAASLHPVHEIIVCDDQSNDATPQILERLGDEIPQLRVIAGKPLPPGWIGKPHACHQLAGVATGDLLLFVDADTFLEPEGLTRLLSLAYPERAAPADVVSAVPRQIMRSFAERLVMPLLVATYTCWLPLFLVSASRDPRFVAANGQLLAVRADSYARLGGFAAVAHEIVDDVAFCRHAKEEGARVVFADGTKMAACRMYDSATAIVEGFSKNIYEGIGGTFWALGLVIALHLGVFVAPYVALIAALAGAPVALEAASIGVGANVAMRAILVLRHDQPIEGILLHPVSVIALCAIAVNSYRWSSRGRVAWAGRSYAARDQRRAVAS